MVKEVVKVFAALDAFFECSESVLKSNGLDGAKIEAILEVPTSGWVLIFLGTETKIVNVLVKLLIRQESDFAADAYQVQGEVVSRSVGMNVGEVVAAYLERVCSRKGKRARRRERVSFWLESTG